MTYKCDHGGEAIPASYYLLELGKDLTWPKAYACCPEHVLKAIEHLLGEDKEVSVSIRRVKELASGS